MMIRAKTSLLAGLVILGGTLASAPAFAGHNSVHFGFAFGFPGYGYSPAPYGYPPAYPYYDPYYYPSYQYPTGPATYIEQAAQPAPPQPQAQWWYYCAEARAYYPYIRECAGGWQHVSPIPPPGS
jgi:hypothetical protein